MVTALVTDTPAEGLGWRLYIGGAEEEPRPAPSLLRGGPAWLDPADAKVVEKREEELERDYGAEAALAALDAVIPEDAGPEARRVISVLVAQSSVDARTIERQSRRLEDLASKLDAQKARSMRAIRGGGAALNKRYRRPRGAFASEQEQHGYEAHAIDNLVYETWFAQTLVGERQTQVLPASWGYAEGFFETFADVDVEVGKVVRCMVDVLTGRTENRNVHALRTGDGAEDAQRRGPNGEKVFRCYVEQGTPQAARLHFMKTSMGELIFSSVRRHDDMRT